MHTERDICRLNSLIQRHSRSLRTQETEANQWAEELPPCWLPPAVPSAATGAWRFGDKQPPSLDLRIAPQKRICTWCGKTGQWPMAVGVGTVVIVSQNDHAIRTCLCVCSQLCTFLSLHQRSFFLSWATVNIETQNWWESGEEVAVNGQP